MQSGIRTSIFVSGLVFLIRLIVLAKCSAPPSFMSSLATAVITACFNPISETAAATLSGSSRSSGFGFLVSTRQKPQARVHLSPPIMKVAVPSFQQSKIFGHPASSQTVTNCFSFIRCFKRLYSGPVSNFTFIQSGFRLVSISLKSLSICNNCVSVFVACSHETSALLASPELHNLSAFTDTKSTTSFIVACIPSFSREVTPYSVIPQGIMWS